MSWLVVSRSLQGRSEVSQTYHQEGARQPQTARELSIGPGQLFVIQLEFALLIPQPVKENSQAKQMVPNSLLWA